MDRKIIHVDMDAFYPSVEVLDRPELKGKPLIVGGSPQSRGVVASANYEARKFGVHSAMSCAKAYTLCPHAIFLAPRMARYREISRQIRAIFAQYTDLIEPVSLDEAWLDVTTNFQQIPSATWVARNIKRQIQIELRLTCSVGVSFNKFLAKIASDEQKPDGLCVISPATAHDFLQQMEVRKIPGVGKVTHKKLQQLGITYGYQLHAQSEAFLVEHFGKMGHGLFHIIRGDDPRPVVPYREPKSVSVETTFASDVLYGPELLGHLTTLTQHLMQRMQKKPLHSGKTMVLKVKFYDFQQITRSMTRPCYFHTFEDILHCAREKLRRVCLSEFPQKPVRLIGVGISNLSTIESTQDAGAVQLDFFHLLSSPPFR